MDVLQPLLLSILAVVVLAGLAEYWDLRIHKKELKDMNLKDFLKGVEQFAPIVLALVPGVPPVLIPVVVHGMQVAEALPGADGAAKKASVIDLVNTGIVGVNAAAGKQVVDPSVINSVSNGIDTVVGVINLVHGKPAAPDKDLNG